MKIATMFLLSSLAPMALASSVVYEEAVVLSAMPVFEQVSVQSPSQACWVERVAVRRNRDHGVGLVVGAWWAVRLAMRSDIKSAISRWAPWSAPSWVQPWAMRWQKIATTRGAMRIGKFVRPVRPLGLRSGCSDTMSPMSIMGRFTTFAWVQILARRCS